MKRGRLDQHRLAGARTLACRRRRICAAGRARARAAAPETVVRASPGARTNWQRCTCSGRNAGLVAEGGAVAGRGRRVVPRAVPAGTRLACTRRPGRWRRRDWRAHRDSALSASTSAARVCANPGPHRRLTSPCARARVSGPTSSMARTQTARTAMGRGVNLCSSAPSARNCLQAGASWRRMPVRVPSVRVKPATLDPRTCARSACLSASLSLTIWLKQRPTIATGNRCSATTACRGSQMPTLLQPVAAAAPSS